MNKYTFNLPLSGSANVVVTADSEKEAARLLLEGNYVVDHTYYDIEFPLDEEEAMDSMYNDYIRKLEE